MKELVLTAGLMMATPSFSELSEPVTEDVSNKVEQVMSDSLEVTAENLEQVIAMMMENYKTLELIEENLVSLRPKVSEYEPGLEGKVYLSALFLLVAVVFGVISLDKEDVFVAALIVLLLFVCMRGCEYEYNETVEEEAIVKIAYRLRKELREAKAAYPHLYEPVDYSEVGNVYKKVNSFFPKEFLFEDANEVEQSLEGVEFDYELLSIWGRDYLASPTSFKEKFKTDFVALDYFESLDLNNDKKIMLPEWESSSTFRAACVFVKESVRKNVDGVLVASVPTEGIEKSSTMLKLMRSRYNLSDMEVVAAWSGFDVDGNGVIELKDDLNGDGEINGQDVLIMQKL